MMVVVEEIAFMNRRPRPSLPSRDIFINYRRADCESAALHLAEDLERCFGSDCVFFDQKRIEAGTKWSKVLQKKLESSKVVLACIGEKWAEVLDDRTRDNRLNDKNDLVRRELEWAKRTGVYVIPVLLEGCTRMPIAAIKLRKSLTFLAGLQPIVLRKGSERQNGIEELLKRLAKLGILPAPPVETRSSSAQHNAASKIPNASPPATNNVLKRVRATKVLRIGFFRYPPLIDYNKVSGDLVATGLYAEALQRFAKKEGLRTEWLPINLSEAITAVTQHEVDCYACIMLSDVRTRVCDFVGLVHSIAVVGVVLNEENSIVYPSDLTHRPDVMVAVCQGEIGHHTAVTRLRIPPRRLIEVNSDDIASIGAHLYDGSATVALADALSCSKIVKRSRGSELKLIFDSPPMLTVPNGFMIAKDNPDFSVWLDAGLRRAFDLPAMQRAATAITEEFGKVLIRW